MKLQNSITVFAGDTQSRVQSGQAERAENPTQKEGKNKTFYAGNFLVEFPLKDRIEQRKAQAQERAMKIVNDAWEGDRKLDKEIEERRAHIEELREENREAIELFGPGGGGTVAQNAKIISEENRIIKGIRSERLKHHNMTDAQEQAEDVVEASRDDVIGMVMEEAKEHVDEEQEKREEQAEAIQEKKEEQEEILEKREEKEEELEQLMEEMPTEGTMDIGQTITEVKRQVQKVLDEVNLMEEDIKGSKVDIEV
ncbi:hypothetical protein [Acetatifactor muris]|jgi:PAS domain-containing protein|uniref:hypothetical protein n=1 Tax=Acetatifactor muris TaxID=879566 RepID=UPI0023F44295|nr:hypothetical protein [Acetatifactor muris]MCI8799244.1 hypothetical protein [Lachnospiraceae bacterium]